MITLGKSKFSFIQCYKAQFDLSIRNKRPVRCVDCVSSVLPGLAIHRRQYRHNGYVCFGCFASHLRVATFSIDEDQDHDAGFRVNAYGQLQACSFSPREHTTLEIMSAVYAALLDLAHTSVDISLGAESVHLWKIGDATEAVIGGSL